MKNYEKIFEETISLSTRQHEYFYDFTLIKYRFQMQILALPREAPLRVSCDRVPQ